jgi:hypothetical protein
MIHDFHPEARLEYREPAIFYDTRRLGLGAAFTLEVEATIERTKGAPERWPVLEQDVRRCLTHIFPYSVLYTIEANSILMISVNHLRRRPSHWRDRLSDPLDSSY